VRIYIKPFVDWIWAGTFLMGLGGVLAVSDRRYRIRRQRTEDRKQKTENMGQTL